MQHTPFPFHPPFPGWLSHLIVLVLRFTWVLVVYYSQQAPRDAQEKESLVKVEDLLQPRDVVTVREDAPVLRALEVMKERGFSAIPVVDELGDLSTIVTVRDIKVFSILSLCVFFLGFCLLGETQWCPSPNRVAMNRTFCMCAYISHRRAALLLGWWGVKFLLEENPAKFLHGMTVFELVQHNIRDKVSLPWALHCGCA